MLRNALFLALFLAPSWALAQDKKDKKDPVDPYGDLGDFKLLKPEDKVDQPGVPPPQGAIVLFDGKNLDGWLRNNGKDPTSWKLVNGVMQVNGGDTISKEKFAGKFKLHVEFRVPYEPGKSGQGRGNSGVYLQGRYEVQVLESYGLKSQMGDCGGIYGVAAPLVNACKAPTVWQSYDIEFTAPTCKDGKVAEPGRITVVHNGVKIHDDVRLVQKKGDKETIVTNTTSGLGGDPCMPGPIMLQDHGHPVQYRNIWVLPLKALDKDAAAPQQFKQLLAQSNLRLAKVGRAYGESLGRALNSGAEEDLKKAADAYQAMKAELVLVRQGLKDHSSAEVKGILEFRKAYEAFLQGQDRIINQEFQEALKTVRDADLGQAAKQQRIQEIMARVSKEENAALILLRQAEADFNVLHPQTGGTSSPDNDPPPTRFNNFLAKGNQRLARAGQTFGVHLGQALNNGGEEAFKTMAASHAAMLKTLNEVRKEMKEYPIQNIDGAPVLLEAYTKFLKGQDLIVGKDFQEAMDVIRDPNLDQQTKQQQLQGILGRVSQLEAADLAILQRAQRDFAAKHNIKLK